MSENKATSRFNTLIFDVASTGFFNETLHYSDAKQPKMVGLSCILEDKDRKDIERFTIIVKPPKGFSVYPAAAKYHGITTEIANDEGVPYEGAVERFIELLVDADRTVAFNSVNHIGVMQSMMHVAGVLDRLPGKPPESWCAMVKSMEPVGKRGRDTELMFPKMIEAYRHFTGKDFDISDAQGIEDRLSRKIDGVRAVYHGLLDLEIKKNAPIDEIPY